MIQNHRLHTAVTLQRVWSPSRLTAHVTHGHPKTWKANLGAVLGGAVSGRDYARTQVFRVPLWCVFHHNMLSLKSILRGTFQNVKISTHFSQIACFIKFQQELLRKQSTTELYSTNPEHPQLTPKQQAWG